MFKSIVLGRSSGFGESIILVLPDNKIGIIDSAINQKTKTPLALEFLERNSICVGNVDFILLTHFHQDHYTGMAEILIACESARFFVTSALWNKNFDILLNMLLQINGKANPYHEFKKIAEVIRFSNRKILAISEKSKPIIANSQYKIKVHSPNKATLDHFNQIYLDQILELKTNAASIPEKKDINLQSVVLEVKINGESFLYSSDLEYSSQTGLGLEVLINKFINSKKRFKIFKVPHHGSDTGYDKKDWNHILLNEAILKITPYNSSNLPKPDMITSICEHSNEVYITFFDQEKYKSHKGKLKKRINALSIDMKRFNLQLKGEIITKSENQIYTTTTFGSATKLKIAT